jgi:hypothetical protein
VVAVEVVQTKAVVEVHLTVDLVVVGRVAIQTLVDLVGLLERLILAAEVGVAILKTQILVVPV